MPGRSYRLASRPFVEGAAGTIETSGPGKALAIDLRSKDVLTGNFMFTIRSPHEHRARPDPHTLKLLTLPSGSRRFAHAWKGPKMSGISQKIEVRKQNGLALICTVVGA